MGYDRLMIFGIEPLQDLVIFVISIRALFFISLVALPK